MKRQDEDQEGLLKGKPLHGAIKQQELPDKIMMYLSATFWLVAAIVTIFYTNFFWHFFFSPKVYEPFHTICICCYVVVLCVLLFSCFVLPYGYGIPNVQDYNPKLMPTASAFGFVGVLTLIISVWPIWGYTTLLIFITLWKGFFSMGAFIPKGIVGDIVFVTTVVLGVMSYKFIPHQGYFH